MGTKSSEFQAKVWPSICSYIACACLYLNSRHNTLTTRITRIRGLRMCVARSTTQDLPQTAVQQHSNGPSFRTFSVTVNWGGVHLDQPARIPKHSVEYSAPTVSHARGSLRCGG